MKKIICLVDYSTVSENALRYAARLALQTSSKLVLVAKEEKVEASDRLVSVSDRANNTQPYSTRLADRADYLRSTWKVRCDYAELSDLSQESLKSLGDDVLLVVKGIGRGRPSTPHRLYQDFNLKALRHISTPYLLIPENYEFKTIKRLVYAHDYINNPNIPLDQLEQLTTWIGADICFLSVVQKKYSETEEASLDRVESLISSKWKNDRAITFDYVFYDNVAKCIDHYLDLQQHGDIVIFTLSKHNLVRGLFHRSLIKAMSVCGDHPMMILPEAKV